MRNFAYAKIILCSLFILSLAACDKSASTAPTKTDATDSSSINNADIKGARVLVFSKTKGWRHDSIPAGIAALQKLAADIGFSVVATEDA